MPIPHTIPAPQIRPDSEPGAPPTASPAVAAPARRTNRRPAKRSASPSLLGTLALLFALPHTLASGQACSARPRTLFPPGAGMTTGRQLLQGSSAGTRHDGLRTAPDRTAAAAVDCEAVSSGVARHAQATQRTQIAEANFRPTLATTVDITACFGLVFDDSQQSALINQILSQCPSFADIQRQTTRLGTRIEWTGGRIEARSAESIVTLHHAFNIASADWQRMRFGDRVRTCNLVAAMLTHELAHLIEADSPEPQPRDYASRREFTAAFMTRRSLSEAHALFAQLRAARDLHRHSGIDMFLTNRLRYLDSEPARIATQSAGTHRQIIEALAGYVRCLHSGFKGVYVEQADRAWAGANDEWR